MKFVRTVFYIVWMSCVLALFLPVTFSIDIASAVLGMAKVAVRTALRVLTFGVFK